MSDSVLRKAFFQLQSGPQAGDRIPVHFNPVSLQYALTNTLKDEGRGNQKKQYVSKSTAKLSMQLVFDTTDTGTDVREHTGKIARLMQPLDGDETMPPVVSFEWGVYKFQGMVETYKETIDFFSEEGIPLRSSVALTLASQEQVFETQSTSQEDRRADVQPQATELPRGESGSASQLANQAGDPNGARQIAQQNGDESLRFPGEGNAVVSEEPNLQGPVAFSSGGGFGAGAGGGLGASAGGGFGASIGGGFGASAGGGFGASAGGGFGASAGGGFGASIGGGFGASAGGGFGASAGGGFGASAGGGFGASAGAGFGAGVTVGGSTQASAGAGAAFGARASAGVPATAGAFAGLHAPAAQRTGRPRMRVSRLVERAPAAGAPGPGTAFRPGGRLVDQGAGAFSADVGASASLNDSIRFEEDEP